MKEYSFEKLDVWKLSKDFTIEIYKLTDNFPETEKYGLISQLRRAAVSVPTNLSEGSGRTSSKDQAHYTQMAFGSLMEYLNLLIICYDISYIQKDELLKLRAQIEEISRKLSNYRRSQLNS